MLHLVAVVVLPLAATWLGILEIAAVKPDAYDASGFCDYCSTAAGIGPVKDRCKCQVELIAKAERIERQEIAMALSKLV
jgi:hypothetical protein